MLAQLKHPLSLVEQALQTLIDIIDLTIDSDDDN
jgi:hypothetical protein